MSKAQCAFLCARNIHENFKLVKNAAKWLHGIKTSAVLMKIDILKAFDTLSSEFLLEVLMRRGFGHMWCSWICGLLASASSKVMINGQQFEAFALACGVRQGDPLSSALFILEMDVLQMMASWATSNRLLSDIGFSPGVLRTSMFADDAVVFSKSLPTYLHVISSLLGLFGDGSGLRMNLNKCSITCIRCDNSLASSMAAFFSCKLQPFLLQYLGIPLSIYWL
ncbi:hypothetical protein D1007_60441 [Hordeum vulgare]|nr:hypothetical protein D1007_60441 [Hordeum vulgare]